MKTRPPDPRRWRVCFECSPPTLGTTEYFYAPGIGIHLARLCRRHGPISIEPITTTPSHVSKPQEAPK